MILRVPCDMLTAKAFIHARKARLVRANGTWVQNKTYCTKNDAEHVRIEGPLIIGVEPPIKQGVSTRRTLATAEVVAGRNPGTREFAIDYPDLYVVNGTMNGLLRLYTAIMGVPRNEKPTVIILWGPGGVGKSTRVTEMPGAKYWKPPGKWWDGYAYEPVVVFNDFQPSAWQYSWNDFKRLSDWCPVRYEMKAVYGGIEFNSRTIYITTNSNPLYWWEDERGNEPGVWENRNIHVFKINHYND